MGELFECGEWQGWVDGAALIEDLATQSNDLNAPIPGRALGRYPLLADGGGR